VIARLALVAPADTAMQPRQRAIRWCRPDAGHTEWLVINSSCAHCGGAHRHTVAATTANVVARVCPATGQTYQIAVPDAMRPRACGHQVDGGTCGTINGVRQYLSGHRCAAHTPAALAGRPEPGRREAVRRAG
jgi:hypothetical protein